MSDAADMTNALMVQLGSFITDAVPIFAWFFGFMIVITSITLIVKAVTGAVRRL